MQRVVAQIPWRTNIALMDKLKTQEERIWYAGKTIENGWSKTILELQIQSKLMERTGKTVNNFPVALPPLDSDMANQIFKDPYLFDFLGTDMPRREVEIEQKLTEHIQSFLLRIRTGICICWATGSFRGWRTGFLFRPFVLSLKIMLLCRDRIESL